MFSHIITYDLSLPCRLGLSLICAFICGRVLIVQGLHVEPGSDRRCGGRVVAQFGRQRGGQSGVFQAVTYRDTAT